MHPSAELIRLEQQKAELRKRIASRRQGCVEAARTLARPLRWLDRLISIGRRLAPIAALAPVLLGFVWRWWGRRRETTGRSHGHPWVFAALQMLLRWLSGKPG